MSKIDFKKTEKHLYSSSAKKGEIVEVPPMNFLMIDGLGHPGENQSFQDAMEAMYGLSYTLKFLYKNKEKPSGYHEYVVLPLEGLWWVKDGKGEDYLKETGNWAWTLMIRQPDFFTSEEVENARKLLAAKKNPTALKLVRFEKYEEGLAAQTLHLGPYDQEGPSIERLHTFIAAEGYEPHMKHHEIYLGDPRRTAPEKLRTILRHPVKKKA